MKGDFSRGFDPDRKRGRDYRRVLLQQGRALLDSDFNASIDAQDQLIREVARDLGCRAGSPDLGFLVTPGRLLALFDPKAAIETTVTGGVAAVRDYNRKYLDRYPALRATAGTAAGTVRIPFLAPLQGAATIALWVLADAPTTVAVSGGANVTVPAQPGFARRTVSLTDAAAIEIALDAGEEIWIGLIETDVDAGLAPSFGLAEGRYYIEGLSLEAVDGPIVLFDLAAGIAPIPNGVTVARDDALLLNDRFPAFRITAGAAAGSVRFPFRFGLTGAAQIDLWLRAAAAAATVGVTGGGNVNVPAGNFACRQVTLNNAAEVEITLDPGEEIWIALIALRSGGGFAPGLWPAIGYGPPHGFAVQDLAVPDAGAPGGTRDLQAGDRLVVYLEGYERHVTAVDDQGLREQALGNGPDTCTRSADIGQAKLAPAIGLDPDVAAASAQASRAFRRRQLPTGALVIDTPPQLDDPDPCALPAAGGYTGLDHRLYRFEIHGGGAVPDAVVKWSRDNGAELFPLFSLTAAQVEAAADTPLRDGDLVELLSEAIELGDAGLAAIDAAQGRFTAPARAVGDLVRLRDEGLVANGTRRRFSLRDPNDEAIAPAVPVVPARYGVPAAIRLKARRWHGTIAAAGGASPFSAALEDGLTVTLTGGGFEPGDWWQYEARVGRDNANGPWRARPHGPERLFAPLALVQFQGPANPLLLLAWLDERFPSLCSIDADDIAFDGGICGTDADTVQEFLEELCDREQGGCCDIDLRPEEAGDDAERIRDALAELAAGVTAVVCLHRGVYRFATTLVVDNRVLVVRGCPEAVVVGQEAGAPLFRVVNQGRLELESLTLLGTAATPLLALIEVATTGARLEARDVGLVNLGQAAGGSAAIRVLGPEPDIAALDSHLTPAPASNLEPGAPEIALERVTVVAQRGIRGGVVSRLALRDSIMAVVGPAVAMADIGTLDLAHSALRTGLDLAATAGWTPDDLLARGAFLVETLLDALPPGGGNQPVFVANGVWSGSARRVLAIGSHGFLLGSTLALTFDHGALFAGAAGIQIKSAAATTIEGQRIAIEGTGTGAGLHLVHTAISVKIAACEINADDFGIVIGAPRSPSDLPGPAVFILGLHVESSTIQAQIGIALGAFGDASLNGSALGVDLHGNHVGAGAVGIVLRGVGENAPSTRAVDVRVRANMVVAPVGIDIIGGSFTLVGNQVAPPPFGQQGGALRAVRSPRLAVEDNRLAAALDGGTVMPAGVTLVSCQDAILRGNTIANSGAFPALVIASTANARVVNNIVGAGQVLISQCAAPIVQGNDIAGAAFISFCAGGTVTDNRTRRFPPGPDGGLSLTIVNAAGDWQVEDNRADGPIAIVPRPVLAGGGLVGVFDRFTAVRDTRALRAFEALGGDAPAAGPRDGGGFATTVEAASFLTGAGGLGDSLVEAVTGSITAAFADTLFANLEPDVIALPAATGEQTFHVQANGNWAEALAIGTTTPGRANQATTVQAIGNRVTGLLFVRDYPRRNVSQNVASAYPAWIASQAGAIGADNLDFL